MFRNKILTTGCNCYRFGKMLYFLSLICFFREINFLFNLKASPLKTCLNDMYMSEKLNVALCIHNILCYFLD